MAARTVVRRACHFDKSGCCVTRSLERFRMQAGLWRGEFETGDLARGERRMPEGPFQVLIPVLIQVLTAASSG
jgi:hypothetical protein